MTNFSFLHRVTIHFCILALLIIGAYILNMMFPSSYIHPTLHSSLESSSAILLIFVGFYELFARYSVVTTRYQMIGLSFIVMGILDYIHAMSQTMFHSVWLHTIAMFLGGLLSLGSYLNPFYIKSQKILFLTFVGISFCFALAIVAYPVHENYFDNFSLGQQILNILSSLFFYSSTLFFLHHYHLSHNQQDKYYMYFLSLFTLIGFLFCFSSFWSISWWLWHSIKFITALMIFAYLLSTIFQKTRELTKTRHSLMEQSLILKEINKELKDNETQLYQAQKLAHLGTWIYTIHEDNLFWSDEVYNIYEIDRKIEPTYDLFESIVHTDDKAYVRATYSNALANQLPITIEHRLLMKDGRVKYVIQSGITEYDLQGHPTRSIGTVQDITEQHLTKLMIQEAKNKLDLAIIAGGVGIWEWDIHQNCLHWDQKMFQLYDISPEHFRSHYQDWKQCIHPDDCDEQENILHRALKDHSDFRTEFRVIHRNGDIHYLKANGIIIYDHLNQPVKMIGTNWDITEQKHYESKLQERVNQETQKRLEQERILIQQSKLALMGEMIGAIAHQWRQPLNALGIVIQDLEDAYEYHEVTQEYIQKLVRKSMSHIEFMSQTIDDFRNFFKINKQKKEFDIIHAVNSVGDIFKGQFSHHNITLHLTCCHDNCRVDCDFKNTNQANECISHHIWLNGYESEFKQVILNILSNALYALNNTNPSLKMIWITFVETNDDIILDISDNGGGIPDDIIDRIFEPYFTTKFKSQGTGIGLYMSKLIIENNMNGSIDVCNDNEGAKFTIRLPKKHELNR